MTVTPNTLFRATGVAAAVAGLIFIGVQIGSPHLDGTTITTTNAVVRDSLKVLMAALALAGISGMYLLQVKKIGVLGLVGYLVFATGYLTMLGIEFVGAFVLPSIAHSSPAYVSNAIAAATNGTVTGSIGLIKVAILVNGIAYVAGGFIFGIALFRANVLARWAARTPCLRQRGNHRDRRHAAVRKAVRVSHRRRPHRPRVLRVASAARAGPSVRHQRVSRSSQLGAK